MKKTTFYIYSRIVFLVVTFSTLLFSCKTSSINEGNKNAEDMATLDSLLVQDNYNIAIEVVYPFNTAATTQVANALLMGTGDNANRIDVRGDGNYIRIRNDSVKAYLPFFGERRLNGGDYGGRNSSIQIDEPLTELSKKINSKKGKIELEFNAEQTGGDTDKYEIRIEIYPNENVMVHINPVYRTFMRYDGVLKSIDEGK